MFFPAMTKLLVASGTFYEYKKSVEIVNLDEENPDLICDSLPELQYTYSTTLNRFATGHLLGETPTLCNDYGNQCEAFQSGSWKLIPKTTVSRDNRPGSASLPNTDGKDVFFETLGRSSPNVNFFEIFDGTVWHVQNYSPLPSYEGCIVKFNSSTIFFIGGYMDDRGAILVKNTYIYNALFNKWTLGPPLNIGRKSLSCGILEWENPESRQIEKVVVVAGGSNSHYLSSVELLYLNDDNSVKGEWMMGPELPDTATSSKMIEYNNSVILIGGYDRYGRNQPLYQLSSPKGPWIAMKQILKEIRLDPVPFLVPDEVVNCHH